LSIYFQPIQIFAHNVLVIYGVFAVAIKNAKRSGNRKNVPE